MSAMKRRAALAIGLIAVILIPSAIKIGSFFFDTLFLGPSAQNANATLDRVFPKMMEDLATWSKSDLARDLGNRERDAGPALNRRLDWKGDLAGFALEPLNSPDGPALMSACEKYPECGAEAFDALALSTNAFDVFAQATEFDHWNADSSSPVEAAAKSTSFGVDSRKPIADFRRLRGLARAFALTSMRSKDPADASNAYKQILHMGRLLLTQQTPEGEAAGAAMLRDAKAAFDAAVAAQTLDPAKLPEAPAFASEEDLARFERLAKTAPAFFEPLATADQVYQLITADRTGSFACLGAARQFSPEASATLAFAEPTAPGEADYRPYAAAASRVFAPSSPCHLTFEREAWNKRESLKVAELESVRAIPWLRRSYFLLRATSAAAEAATTAKGYN